MASGAPGPGLGGCQGRSRNEPSVGNIARGRAKVLTRARNAIGASSATQILFLTEARASPGTLPSIRNERGGAKGTSVFFLGNGLNKYGSRQGGEEEAESFQTGLAASGGCRCGSPRILAWWQSTLPLPSQRVRRNSSPKTIGRKPENMCLKLLLSGFQIKHIQRGPRVLLAGRAPLQTKHLAEERRDAGAGDTHPFYGRIQRWCRCCQESKVSCRSHTTGKGVWTFTNIY